jgi:hypothetical protein
MKAYLDRSATDVQGSGMSFAEAAVGPVQKLRHTQMPITVAIAAFWHVKLFQIVSACFRSNTIEDERATSSSKDPTSPGLS